MNIEELAAKYIELARENVNVKKIFPPNRYTFTKEYFRPIKGWDPEWYEVMSGWMTILEEKGWKVSFYDRDAGEMTILNWEYLYDSKLPSCSVWVEPAEAMVLIDVSQLTGEKCSQLSLGKEEFYKLSNPPSKPIDPKNWV